jgi:hypothetical protein
MRARTRSSFTLQNDGYFHRAGQRVVPIGVNYWPGSCGAAMWTMWPESEIQRDLDTVTELGLNCVRFFLRWEDFAPSAERIEAQMLQRLGQMLTWHQERGLMAHPSLFVGWMSGAIFRPKWHRSRNWFSSAKLRARAVALAKEAAAVCAEFPETVLAIDQGNELNCLPDCMQASVTDVGTWCESVSKAIKTAFPTVLVVSGNDQHQINSDTGWRLGEQRGCDFYSVHTYPFPAWHAWRCDGLEDPRMQTLLPFYVKCARAFGPVMVQEFGTLLTGSPQKCDRYLRAVLPACADAGANGFLWWCLRDIESRSHPYNKNPFEGLLGLVDEQRRVKDGLGYFLEFGRQLKVAPRPGESVDTAIYWPNEYYARENPRNPGNQPNDLGRGLAIAHYALTTIRPQVRVTRLNQLRDLRRTSTLVIAGAKLTATEVAELDRWVKQGGILVFQGADPVTWGPELTALAGAAAVDFRAPEKLHVRMFGERWTFLPPIGSAMLELTPTTAKALHASRRYGALLLVNKRGRGRVITSPLDLRNAVDGDDRAKAVTWYRGLIRQTG